MNPLFVQYGVKKNDVGIFCIIVPVENRFDRDIFFVWFDYQNQRGDHAYNKYEVITRVNYRADKEQFYTQMMHKIDIMSILRRCKKVASQKS